MSVAFLASTTPDSTGDAGHTSRTQIESSSGDQGRTELGQPRSLDTVNEKRRLHCRAVTSTKCRYLAMELRRKPHTMTWERVSVLSAQRSGPPLPSNELTHRFPMIPNLPRRDRGLPWSIVLGRHKLRTRLRGPPRIYNLSANRFLSSRALAGPYLIPHERAVFNNVE